MYYLKKDLAASESDKDKARKDAVSQISKRRKAEQRLARAEEKVKGMQDEVSSSAARTDDLESLVEHLRRNVSEVEAEADELRRMHSREAGVGRMDMHRDEDRKRDRNQLMSALKRAELAEERAALAEERAENAERSLVIMEEMMRGLKGEQRMLRRQLKAARAGHSVPPPTSGVAAPPTSGTEPRSLIP